MKIRLSKAAISDLRETQAYISLDSPVTARQVVVRLQKAVELIAERPEIGRLLDGGGTREWSVPRLPYVIPYRVTGSGLKVLRFWHTSRDRPAAW
jgi:plasmid stabilization system protein ParE